MKFILSAIIILFCSILTHVKAQKLKILSYNIHHGNPPSEAKDIINLDTIASIIKKSKADIVGLQEIDVNLTRSFNVDQAKKLAELTGMHFSFSKGIDIQDGQYGTMILSKYPIISIEKDFLPSPVKSEQRSLASATIQVGKKKIIFANTHLDLKEENKIAQAKFITDKFKNAKLPVILVGDLNSKPGDLSIKELENSFIRSQIKNGNTFPQDQPNTEIDYILVSKLKKAKFSKHRVLEESYASDHRPLFVEILIK